MFLREFWCLSQLNQEQTAMMDSSTRIARSEVVDLCETIFAANPDLPAFGARVLGLYLCVPDTDVPEAQPAPGASRRGLRRLAGHRLPSRHRLHTPDRPGFGSQCADCGGSGSHRAADRRWHPPSVLVLGRPPRAVLRQAQDHRSERPGRLHPVRNPGVGVRPPRRKGPRHRGPTLLRTA